MNRKNLWVTIAFWLATSYIVSLVVFWYGAFFAACWWAALIVLIVLLGGGITLGILKAKGIISFDKLTNKIRSVLPKKNKGVA